MSKPKVLTGEVIGFRQWKVGDELELQSANASHNWTPGVNTAKCDPAYNGRPCKRAPGKTCHCGLYALHSPDDFWYGEKKNTITWLTWGTDEGIYVAGLVSAWGRIEVHHDGFRAEHAKVVAISMPEAKRGAAIARAVAYEYKVPRVPENELAGMASEYGSLVPEHLRPAKPKRTELAPSTWYSGYVTQLNQHIQNYQIITTAGASQHLQPGQIHYTNVSPLWTPGAPGVETSEPGDGSLISEIEKLKKPINDPRQYLPKRKGGFR